MLSKLRRKRKEKERQIMGGSTSGEKEKKKKGSFMGAGTRGEKEIKLKGGLLCWKKKERQI